MLASEVNWKVFVQNKQVQLLVVKYKVRPWLGCNIHFSRKVDLWIFM